MNTRFQILLHRFQSNVATDKERKELMEMIDSGHYDEPIGEEWETLLQDNLESSGKGDKIPDRKLSTIKTGILLENKNTKYKRKSLVVVLGGIATAAAVSLLLILTVNWESGSIHPEKGETEIVVNEVNGHTYTGKQYVTLPDGSSVMINENSALRYKSDFGEQIREVYLTGEAYFDVAHNEEVPFLVRTGEIKTKVLGTAFNIEAWPDQPEVKVTVTRGKVSVGDDRKIYEELAPNEQLSVNTQTKDFEKKKLDAEAAIEWKSSFFVLDKVTMDLAARRISERYNVKVIIENKKLRNCRVNGAFLDNEDVEHVVSVLCLAMNATYEMEGNKVKIFGGIGCE